MPVEGMYLLNVATDIQNLAPKESPYTQPDERHIRYQDARDLKAVVYTEFNRRKSAT
jgi:pyridoxine 5-phosphate synthase